MGEIFRRRLCKFETLTRDRGLPVIGVVVSKPMGLSPSQYWLAKSLPHAMHAQSMKGM